MIVPGGSSICYLLFVTGYYWCDGWMIPPASRFLASRSLRSCPASYPALSFARSRPPATHIQRNQARVCFCYICYMILIFMDDSSKGTYDYFLASVYVCTSDLRMYYIVYHPSEHQNEQATHRPSYHALVHALAAKQASDAT